MEPADATGMETSVRATAKRGRAYLQRKLDDGDWHDLWRGNLPKAGTRRSHGMFALFFITRALSESGGLRESDKKAILSLTAVARQGPSFAYCAHAPVDADDTAFAIRTERLAGRLWSREDVVAALASFSYGDSWTTFDREASAQLRRWVTMPNDDDCSIGLHPEVHLNVLALLRETGVQRSPCVPEDLPKKDGLYASFHYPSRLYLPWLVAELLGECGDRYRDLDYDVFARHRDDGTWAGLAKGFASHQETALALLTLSRPALRDSRAHRACAALSEAQGEDGSWPSGVMWYFHRMGTGGVEHWWCEDPSGVFGTSLAVMALARFEMHLERPC